METEVAPKPPARAKVMDIIRRYLKKDSTPVWSRELPLMYGLWKGYPSLSFWTKHTLPFELNSMAWFSTIQGKAQLVSDWAVFHYVPEPESAAPVDPLDIFPRPELNLPSTPPPKRRPRSVADLLSAPPSSS